MIRHFNYTGRKKIPAAAVTIQVGPERKVRASWKSPEELGVPASGSVYVEAFTSGSPFVERFAFGTVGTPETPSNAVLPEWMGDSVAYNFKVVDEVGEVGRLIAIAANVSHKGEGDEEAGQQSILPVNPADLGNQVWRLTFSHGRPWLEVNNRIDGIMETARSDRRFFALVFPAVVREILTRILVVQEFTDPDADRDDWKVQWLRWGVHWHPDHEHPAEGERDEQEDSWLAWIEEVCSAFCDRHDVRHLFEVPASEEADL